MNKAETIEFLCNLADQVAAKVYGHNMSADCLCRGKHQVTDKAVLDFIQDAVNVKIASFQENKFKGGN